MGGPRWRRPGWSAGRRTGRPPSASSRSVGAPGRSRRAFRRLRSGDREASRRARCPHRLSRVQSAPRGIARRAGVPVVYFIPPQIWAWRPGRVRRSGACALVLGGPALRARPLPARRGARRVRRPPRARPLAEAPRARQARRRSGSAPSDEVIGLLPGSRAAEISAVLAAHARRRGADRPRPSAGALRAGPGPDRGRTVVGRPLGAGVGHPVVGGQTYAVMRAADLLLVTSGTATLEAALLGTPMVVCYRLAALSELIAQPCCACRGSACPIWLPAERSCPSSTGGPRRPAGLARVALGLLAEREGLAAQRAAFSELADAAGSRAASPPAPPRSCWRGGERPGESGAGPRRCAPRGRVPGPRAGANAAARRRWGRRLGPLWREERPLIYAVWHGRILMPWLNARLAARRGPAGTVLASRSRTASS